jgi:hypothetical protein
MNNSKRKLLEENLRLRERVKGLEGELKRIRRLLREEQEERRDLQARHEPYGKGWY